MCHVKYRVSRRSVKWDLNLKSDFTDRLDTRYFTANILGPSASLHLSQRYSRCVFACCMKAHLRVRFAWSWVRLHSKALSNLRGATCVSKCAHCLCFQATAYAWEQGDPSCVCTCTHTPKARACTRIHKMHTHTYTHACSHACAHTHTHTHTV
jgi:hypothetical protein